MNTWIVFLPVLLFLGLISSCGQKHNTSHVVKLNFSHAGKLDTSPTLNETLVYLKNGDGSEVHSVRLGNTATEWTITLPSGIWDFKVVGWSDPNYSQHPLQGDIYCGSTTEVLQDGEGQKIINVIISKSQCNSPELPAGSSSFAMRIKYCHPETGVLDETCDPPLNTDNPLWIDSKTYYAKIFIPALEGGSATSKCIPLNTSSGESDIADKIFLFPHSIPVNVNIYQGDQYKCDQNPLDTYQFSQGLSEYNASQDGLEGRIALASTTNDNKILLKATSLSAFYFAGINSIINIGDVSATLTWIPAVGASSYNVYRIIPAPTQLIASVAPEMSTYNVTGLSANTTYTYKVIAIDGTTGSTSGYNALQSFTTLSTISNHPPVATGASASTSENVQVTIDLPYTSVGGTVAKNCTAYSPIHGTIGTCTCTTGGICSVDFTPELNFSGMAAGFTYKVNNGSDSSADSNPADANIFVTFVNQPPTIDPINNQAIYVNTATSAIPFNIGDVETPLASLTPSANSSNTTLLPVSNIVFGGSGANRTVTLTPASGKTGNATVTISVSDGTLTSSRTFILNVTYNFAGLSSVDQITDTGARLNWAHIAGIASYNIYNTTSGSAVFVASVPAPTTSYTMTTLTPSTSYHFKVNAVDINGQLDTNNTTQTFSTSTASNQAPVATNITPAYTSENVPVTIPLPYTDRESNLATSCSTSSVTNGSTGTCSCPGGNCSVTFTPATNYYGTASFSYTVTTGDSQISNLANVVISVSHVNQPPTITPDTITDQTMPVSTPSLGPIVFTIGDPDTNINSLNVTITSSNTALIPNANITPPLGGTGASRSITLQPITGKTGKSIITISVSDGELTTARTFSVSLYFPGLDPITTYGAHTANLTWNNYPGLTLYNIYRTYPLPVTLIDTVPPPTSSYTVTGLAANTNYSFSVIALDASLHTDGGDYVQPVLTSPGSLACPTGYVPVPGNNFYGEPNEFCVSKYIMGCPTDITGMSCPLTDLPVSLTGHRPWVNIAQTDAHTRCQALGAGHYNLISNTKWMTIATNLANNHLNWISNSVGTGTLYVGHSNNTPPNSLAPGSDDYDGYYGTGDAIGSDQRRTMYLSNGEIIWDFSGNVFQWTLWNIPSAPATFIPDTTLRTDKASPQAISIELNTATATTSMPLNSYMPNNPTYDSTNGVGLYYPDVPGIGGAAIRGGAWGSGNQAGIFSLQLYYNSTTQYSNTMGYRCTWVP